MTRHIVSIDAESNGLAGRAFAVALLESGSREGIADDYAVYRCPIEEVDVNPWVAANVLPAIEDLPVNCADYVDLCATVRRALDLWDPHAIIGHVLWPVEARLLFDVYPDPFDAPYPLLDVAAMLHQAGEEPTTVDGYLDANGIAKPEGSPHHPLYDARAAATAYWHLRGFVQPQRYVSDLTGDRP